MLLISTRPHGMVVSQTHLPEGGSCTDELSLPQNFDIATRPDFQQLSASCLDTDT